MATKKVQHFPKRSQHQHPIQADEVESPQRSLIFTEEDYEAFRDFWTGMNSLEELSARMIDGHDPASEPLAYFIALLSNKYGDLMEGLAARIFKEEEREGGAA